MELICIQGGLHHHVVLARLTLSLGYAANALQTGSHRNGAGAMLPCLQNPNSLLLVHGDGGYQVNGIDRRILQNCLKGIICFETEYVGYMLCYIGIGVIKDNFSHIGVLLVNVHKGAAKAQSY